MALTLLTIVLCSTGCNDIFEQDITEKTVDIIIPQHNDTLYSNNVHFKWNELEGATFYNLQIVKPSFEDIEIFVLDSNIAAAEFHQILLPGDYEYHVRGENSAYFSNYTSEQHFYVDSVADLSDQHILIISPVDNNYINGESDILMTWQSLYAADLYDVILKTGESFESGTILDQVLGQASLGHTMTSDLFTIEGKYYCGVRGVNESGVSPYSNHTILVDKTEPNVPDLISPFDATFGSVDTPIIFKWNTGVDPGSINSQVNSTIEISNSVSFIDYIDYTDITIDSLSYTFSSVGDYWWRVRTNDAVGNISAEYSEKWKITIE